MALFPAAIPEYHRTAVHRDSIKLSGVTTMPSCGVAKAELRAGDQHQQTERRRAHQSHDQVRDAKDRGELQG
jgi:hypothetical protein